MKDVAENKDLEVLILGGKNFLESFDFTDDKALVVLENSGLVVPIGSQIDKWIESGARYVYSLFPKKIIESDFVDVADICRKDVNKNKVITSHYKQAVKKVLTALETCRSFCQWFSAFELEKLNIRQTAKYNFCFLEAVASYIQKEVILLFVNVKESRTKQTALIHLYGRIFQLVLSIIKLDEHKDCQLLVASLRSLLELYIDMQLIKSSIIENDIEKFFSFYEIYLFNSASKLLKIDQEIRRPMEEALTLMQIVKNSEQIKNKSMTLWKKEPNKISHGHWSEFTLQDRCRKANELELFRHIYYYGNMFIHSGYTHSPNTEEEAYCLCSHVYGCATEILKKATELLFEVTGIAQKDEISKELEQIYIFESYQIWKYLSSN
ncbi:MAG: hypothetical protein A2Y12_11935 [Planctomycetes bacterium GWF2_42_9]|nr:MAG: hypothetical protein A2Y12_11935 [Planctomycetes bacterium GWF2_42_9]